MLPWPSNSTPDPDIYRPSCTCGIPANVAPTLVGPTPSGARRSTLAPRFPAIRFWLFLLLTLNFAHTRSGNNYDATGREVSFYPNAMMIAKNPKALVLYRDTKLVSVHINLKNTLRCLNLLLIPPVTLNWQNSTIAFSRPSVPYKGPQNRLLSIQGVTDLLECNRYLRRYYTYVASHTDILLAHHAIFPPQRTSAETSGAFLSHCLKISPGDHAEIT